MVRYKVMWDEVTSCETIVEANTLDEAREKSYWVDRSEVSACFNRRENDEVEFVGEAGNEVEDGLQAEAEA